MADPKVHLTTQHPQIIDPTRSLAEHRRINGAKLAGLAAVRPWCWKCDQPVMHILFDHEGDTNGIKDGRMTWRARHHGEWTTIDLEKASSQIENQRVAQHLRRLWLFAPESYYGAVNTKWNRT